MFICKGGKFVHRALVKWQTVSVEHSQVHVHVDWFCECVFVCTLHICTRVRLSVSVWLAVAPSAD